MALYELDPKGDILLTLHNPNAPFAVWDGDYSPTELDLSPQPEPEPEPESESPSETESLSESEPILAEIIENPIEELDVDGPDSRSPPVQFLVSSRHLSLASEYFKHLLDGPWKEGTVIHSDGRRHISATDWDETAMLILMQIIHGRNRQVPKSITLETRAKVAVLVDYYRCHEAVVLWSDLWDAGPRPDLPRSCDRNLLLWILIASVFEKGELFRESTEIALSQSKTYVPTAGLPIVAVIDKLNARRLDYLDRIFNCLRALSVTDSMGCNFACSSMLLGALTIQMHQKGLDKKPQPPYNGYSIASAMDMILKFQTPRWQFNNGYGNGFGNGPHSGCTLSKVFAKKLPGKVQGLDLEDI